MILQLCSCASNAHELQKPVRQSLDRTNYAPTDERGDVTDMLTTPDATVPSVRSPKVQDSPSARDCCVDGKASHKGPLGVHDVMSPLKKTANAGASTAKGSITHGFSRFLFRSVLLNACPVSHSMHLCSVLQCPKQILLQEAHTYRI